MSENPFTEKRKAIVWELIAEGHPKEVWKWIPQIARREAYPALALGSDHLFATMRREFPNSRPDELAAAIHSEERAVRRAEKIGQPATSPTATAQQGWLRRELASFEPSAAWGMACQLQLLAETNLHPDIIKNAGELYKQLRLEKMTPREIVHISRQAKRSVRLLEKS